MSINNLKTNNEINSYILEKYVRIDSGQVESVDDFLESYTYLNNEMQKFLSKEINPFNLNKSNFNFNYVDSFNNWEKFSIDDYKKYLTKNNSQPNDNLIISISGNSTNTRNAWGSESRKVYIFEADVTPTHIFLIFYCTETKKISKHKFDIEEGLTPIFKHIHEIYRCYLFCYAVLNRMCDEENKKRKFNNKFSFLNNFLNIDKERWMLLKRNRDLINQYEIWKDFSIANFNDFLSQYDDS